MNHPAHRDCPQERHASQPDMQAIGPPHSGHRLVVLTSSSLRMLPSIGYAPLTWRTVTKGE